MAWDNRWGKRRGCTNIDFSTKPCTNPRKTRNCLYGNQMLRMQKIGHYINQCLDRSKVEEGVYMFHLDEEYPDEEEDVSNFVLI